MYNYAPVNNQPIDVDGNLFNFTASQGIDVGALRFSQNSGTQGYVNFTNNSINVDMSSPNGINGVIASNGVSVVGVTIDNVDVAYSNGSSSRPFGYLREVLTVQIQYKTVVWLEPVVLMHLRYLEEHNLYKWLTVQMLAVIR